MIVQESRIKTRSGYQAVSRHVLSGPKNEAIRILSGSDYLLKDWMKEARRENIRYGLRHIAFNPSEYMSNGQLTHFANQICRELGADPERLTLVIHQKDGGTHGHLLLPEWQDDHVLSSRFTWQRLEKLARLEELRLGHALVSGRHDKAIARALREAGNPEAADRIAALAPEENSARPVSAYTSQARRMTERQDFDLPAARHEIMAFWEKSGNDLKTFRQLLAKKNWRMRSGDRTDRTDRRREAHVIETEDGMLIGSFTRLTKVRMKDFRLLLEEEAARPSPVDLRPVVKRLERRETRHQQREERKRKNEDLIWAPPDPLSVLDRQRFQEHGRKEVDMIRKRLPSIGSPRYPEQFSEGFQIYLEDWKREMQAARAVLNARHPLERRYGPESPLDIQTACILQMMREGWVKLKQANQTIAQARQRLEARKSPFFRKSRISEAEEQYRQALAQLAEILRYLVQFILYHLGLSSQKPDPIQIPVPTEREVTWQDYLQDRRELLQTLLDEKTRRVWIKDRCREAEHRRAHVIAQWHADRVQGCDQAQQTVARLEQLARLPRQLPEDIRLAVRDLKRQGQFQTALRELDRFYDRNTPVSPPSDHRAGVNRSLQPRVLQEMASRRSFPSP